MYTMYKIQVDRERSKRQVLEDEGEQDGQQSKVSDSKLVVDVYKGV